MLDVRNVSVSYGNICALDDVSLKAEQGEISAIVGANGAGKSSLLKAISGTAPLDRGTITFDGVDILRIRAADRPRLGMAHVPEGRQVFSDMTVEENLMMGAACLSGVSEKKQFEFVYDVFPILKERRHQLAGTFSGGQQQMLAIGRGLMMAPRLMLLDEPSLGLAPVIVKEIFSIIRRLCEEFSLTVVLVEQRVEETLSACDSCNVLSSGKLVSSQRRSEIGGRDFLAAAYFG